eukprot:RCo004419
MNVDGATLFLGPCVKKVPLVTHWGEMGVESSALLGARLGRGPSGAQVALVPVTEGVLHLVRCEFLQLRDPHNLALGALQPRHAVRAGQQSADLRDGLVVFRGVDCLVRHLRECPVLMPREEGNSLELVLEEVQRVREHIALSLRVKRHRSRNLVVRPVPLHEGSQAELLPHRHLGDATDAWAHVNGNLNHHRGVLTANSGLHSVARCAQAGQHGEVLCHSHTADVEAALRIVDPRGRACENGDCPRGLHRGELAAARDVQPAAQHNVPGLNSPVACLQPVLEGVQVVRSDELGDARDTAPDPTVAKHHLPGLRPVN